MSGFVLAQAYGDSQLSFSAFIRIRLIRFYPLYLVGTLLGIAAVALHRPDAVIFWSIPANLLLLPTPINVPAVIVEAGALFPFDGSAWSLFFELVVNMVWFALLPVLNRRRLLVLCLVAAGLLVGLALFTGSVFYGTNWPGFWGGFCRAPYSFFVGVAIFGVWRSGAVTFKPPAWLIAACTMAIFMIPGTMLTAVIAIIFAFPMIVIFGANNEINNRYKKLCTFLGDLSYAIYIIHIPLIALATYLVETNLDKSWMRSNLIQDHPSVLVAPISVFLVISLGYVLDRYFDTPLRKWLVRRFKLRSA